MYFPPLRPMLLFVTFAFLNTESTIAQDASAEDWLSKVTADAETKNTLRLCATSIAANFEALTAAAFEAEYQVNDPSFDASKPNDAVVVKSHRFRGNVWYRRSHQYRFDFKQVDAADKEIYSVLKTPAYMARTEWHFQDGPFVIIEFAQTGRTWRGNSQYKPFVDPSVFYCAGYAANGAEVFKSVLQRFNKAVARPSGDLVEVECEGSLGRFVFQFDTTIDLLPVSIRNYADSKPTTPASMSIACEWRKVSGHWFPATVSRHATVGEKLEDVETDRLVSRNVQLNDAAACSAGLFTLSALPFPTGGTGLDRRESPPVPVYKVGTEIRPLRAGERAPKLPSPYLDRLRHAESERKAQNGDEKETAERQAQDTLTSRRRRNWARNSIYGVCVVALVFGVMILIRRRG